MERGSVSMSNGASENWRRGFAVNSFRGFIVKEVQRNGTEVGGTCGVEKFVCHLY